MKRCDTCGITTSAVISSDHPVACSYSTLDQLQGYLNSLGFRMTKEGTLICSSCDWEVTSSLLDFGDKEE